MRSNDEKTSAVASRQGKFVEAEGTCLDLRRVVSPQTIFPYIPRKRQERSGLLLDYLFSPAGSNKCNYLDFLLLGENRFGVILADFSGNLAADGLPLLKLALRSKSTALSPAATLRYLDQHIAETSTNGFLVTALYLIFDQNKRLLHFANAGHLPMLLHRPLDNKTFLLTASGAPFGQDFNGLKGISGINKIKGESIVLRQGDLIVLYSSGLLNQRNRHGECFGRQRLVDFFRKYGELDPTSFLAELQRQLDAFVDGEPLERDVVVVALKNVLRDLDRPPAETLEHDISGRFLCVEEEQIILEALRDHPEASISQIATDLAAHDLRHLGNDLVQAYLAQTSHWRLPRPVLSRHSGQNGALSNHGQASALPSIVVNKKATNAAKQMQQDLLAAFPIRQVLYKKCEFRGQNALVARAMEFYNNGDYQKALFEFSRIREGIQNSAAVHCFFGNLYLLVNMIVRAKHEYLLALKFDQRSSHAHMALSYVALLQEDFYTAIDELSTALRLDKNLQAHNSFLQKLIAAVEKRENRSEWLV